MITFSDGLSLSEHLVAGGLATATAVTVMHPLDTVKIFMQRASQLAAASTSPALARHTMPTAAQAIIADRGVLGLYSGLNANLAGQVPSGAVKFAMYETLKQFLVQPHVPAQYRSLAEVASAAVAFLSCSVLLVPGEVVKSRLQAGVYRTFHEGLLRILREEGVRGLYTGYLATVIRDVPYTMLEFGLYEQLKRACRWTISREQLHAREEWAMGGVAGGMTGWLTTPLDVIKTKLMTASRSQYRGMPAVVREVLERDGIPGLFTGGLARVLWLVPFTAVFFGTHEILKRKLLQVKYELGPSAEVSRMPMDRRRARGKAEPILQLGVGRGRAARRSVWADRRAICDRRPRLA